MLGVFVAHSALVPFRFGSLPRLISNLVDQPDPVYTAFRFNALAMVAWGAGSMLVAYRSELG